MLFLLGAGFAPAPVVAADLQRVLIINSYGPENSPYGIFASMFRSELAHRTNAPVAFYETVLDGARFDPVVDTEPFVQYLHDRFASRPPDLVVPIGPPATRFFAQNRERLFPGAPMLLAIPEERVLKGIALGPRDGGVAIRLDIPALIANILQVLPKTSTVAVVIGDSPIERFWVSVMQAEFKRFEGRVSFEYLNKLPLAAIEQRVAALPPGSAVLFVQLFVDGGGASREHDAALGRLLAASSAPVFGLYATELGKGIVGGPLLSEKNAAVRVAEVAASLLDDTLPARGVLAEPILLDAPAYDWAALRRWAIPEARLPGDAVVVFRVPTLWQEIKWAVLVTAVIVLLQSLLLAGLLVQRARRQRAERDALMLSGRILTAHEDERRHLARELHDDVTPRLARLAIQAAALPAPPPGAGPGMQQELASLSEDVHAFSYRLHPAMLDDLGLVDALRAECDRTGRGQDLRVSFTAHEVPDRLPGELALCLFRIAQEALRNIIRHARAAVVLVELARGDGGLRLTVADDGAGFDVVVRRDRHGLGHASMRERVRQAGGNLSISSAPGAGTTIVAWVPLPKTAT
jgi:signal transduction histidine kinase